MNLYAFKNRFKYGYKKFFAILFGVLGLAAQIVAFVLEIVTGTMEGSPNILSLITHVFILIAYYYLLSGNIRGTTIAYRGFLIFVFYTIIDFAFFLIEDLIGSFGSFASGEMGPIVLEIIFIGFSVLCFLSGVMTYIKFRQYQSFGYKTTYENVRNWCLLFTILTVVVYGGSIPIYFLILYPGLDPSTGLAAFILIFIEPIATMMIAICSYFTILRLKD